MEHNQHARLTNVHVIPAEATEARPAAPDVELAIDYADPTARALAVALEEDDAQAVVDLTRDDAVALAFRLLAAAGFAVPELTPA